MKKNQTMIAAVLSAMLLWPMAARADIVQRQVITAISDAPDSEGADVLTVAETTACGGNQLRIKQGLLYLDEQLMPQAIGGMVCPSGCTAIITLTAR